MLHLLRRAALAAAFGACALPAPASTAAAAAEVTIPTARGEVSLPAAPARVAVLDIAALDTLAALGVAAAGVPDRLYVDYLAGAAEGAAVVGTLFEPDLEALAVLAPDLIVIGGRSAAQAGALAPIAPTIDMTIGPDLLGEARGRLRAYGALFGKADRAAELEAALDGRITAARTAVEGKGRALILMTNGPKVSAYGRGSRFGWIHDSLGLPEAHPDLDPQTHGDAVSFEFIAEVNPDWLIVIDRSAAIGEPASAPATLDNPLVAATTAGRTGQIVTLSAAPVYVAGGGYTSLMTTLDEFLAGFGG